MRLKGPKILSKFKPDQDKLSDVLVDSELSVELGGFGNADFEDEELDLVSLISVSPNIFRQLLITA